MYPGDDHNLAANLSAALQRSVAFFDKYVKIASASTPDASGVTDAGRSSSSCRWVSCNDAAVGSPRSSVRGGRDGVDGDSEYSRRPDSGWGGCYLARGVSPEEIEAMTSYVCFPFYALAGATCGALFAVVGERRSLPHLRRRPGRDYARRRHAWLFTRSLTSSKGRIDPPACHGFCYGLAVVIATPVSVVRSIVLPTRRA